MEIQTNIPYLSRDINSTALLNKNVDEFLAYKARRQMDARMEDVIADVEEIKSDISEIKECLKALLVGR